MDDFNREAQAIEIDLNIPALRVVRVLDRTGGSTPEPQQNSCNTRIPGENADR